METERYKTIGRVYDIDGGTGGIVMTMNADSTMILASLVLRIYRDTDGSVTVGVSQLHVEPCIRRQRFGTILFKLLFQLCKEHAGAKVSMFEMGVSRDNAAALAFYENLAPQLGCVMEKHECAEDPEKWAVFLVVQTPMDLNFQTTATPADMKKYYGELKPGGRN